MKKSIKAKSIKAMVAGSITAAFLGAVSLMNSIQDNQDNDAVIPNEIFEDAKIAVSNARENCPDTINPIDLFRIKCTGPKP